MKLNDLLMTCCVMAASLNPLAAETKVAEDNEKPKLVETADWHLDEECRMVFFTVLEGLYRDGVPSEVVDLVIGRVERNSVEKRFVFRCKLCHASYEAFALYQRRPEFSGTNGLNTIGAKPIAEDVMKSLREDAGDREFGQAFSTIIQPWIKQKLLSMDLSDREMIGKIEKFAKLAQEGNALITGYKSCQACDAIEEASKIINEKG